MSAVDLIWVAAGVVLVVLTLRDAFHEVFHPSGSGTASDALPRLTWRAMRRSHRTLHLAGPSSIVAIIVMWSLGLLLGFALIYVPFLPSSFAFGPGTPAAGGFATAVYVSAMSVSTVGFGDITAVSILLQLAMGVEALLGIGLLTASLSWIVQIYPVLMRRQTLAQQLQSLPDFNVSPRELETLLWNLSAELASCRSDLRRFRATYYFHPADHHAELPRGLGAAHSWLNGLDDEERCQPSVMSLESALKLVAQTLREQYLHSGDAGVAAVVRAYQQDHRVDDGNSGG